MRLIDADKLTNKIDAYMINNQDVMFVRKLINETETEEVAPVDKAEAYKIVFEDIAQCRMFHGHYDARNSNRIYMSGILTVMEALAYRADETTCDAFVSLFISNMIKSEKKAWNI